MQKLPEAEARAAPLSSPDLLLGRLSRMGITAWHEPLLCLPKSYLDFSQACTLRKATDRINDVPASPQFMDLSVSEKAVMVSQPKKRLVLWVAEGTLRAKLVIFSMSGTDAQKWKRLSEGRHTLTERPL